MLALCKAGPLINNVESAERLLAQLSPYLLEAHAQAIAPSPYFRLIEPSPWEALSYNLVVAMLAIGSKYPRLHSRVCESTFHYLENSKRFAKISTVNKDQEHNSSFDKERHDILCQASISVSILGFLRAASAYLYFYTIAEQLHVITSLQEILSESFMVSVEGAFSSIRTSESVTRDVRDWKYFTRHYARSGRPLGATLLQRGFMRLLVSCSSMQVSSIKELQNSDILELLLAGKPLQHVPNNEENAALLRLITNVATEEMFLLQDGADYLQLGSAWQQRLAFAVKRFSLIAFLNCMLADEDIADADLLISWLEDTMADPVQMADNDLAGSVLKMMAVAAKTSPAIASAFSRSLPRFIVQGGVRGPTISVAARCLTYILQLLSQDAIITCLYSLGNVLSASSSAEKGMGSLATRETTQQTTGSAISLQLGSDQDTSAVYKNVVCAIVGIATTCKDDKITALAQSMLLQKLGRISLTVDLYIIGEAARLAAGGGQVDLSSLLKLYSRFCHEGVVQGNVALLEAVSISYSEKYLL